MARVERTIEVNVPVRTAYNQWTQFESFPHFMEGVEEVRQLDDQRLHWRAKVGPKVEEWDAVIREQVPDEKIIWQNTTGAMNAGMVKFDPLGAAMTRVHLEMSYDPEGFLENVGDKLGFFSRRVEGDLQRFKEFIESRGNESGAWRGTIENERVPGGHTRGSMDAGEGRDTSPGDRDDGTRFERGAGGPSSFSEPDRADGAGMRGTGTGQSEPGGSGLPPGEQLGAPGFGRGESIHDERSQPGARGMDDVGVDRGIGTAASPPQHAPSRGPAHPGDVGGMGGEYPERGAGA